MNLKARQLAALRSATGKTFRLAGNVTWRHEPGRHNFLDAVETGAGFIFDAEGCAAQRLLVGRNIAELLLACPWFNHAPGPNKLFGKLGHHKVFAYEQVEANTAFLVGQRLSAKISTHP